MSEPCDVCYTQGKMLTYDTAVMLEAIAADLRQGVLSVAGENGPKRVVLPACGTLEIEFKQKVRPDKSKFKLEIEIVWKEEAEESREQAPAPDAA